MRREELLGLQSELIERLSNPARGGAEWRGIAAARLDLMGDLTHAKRMDKIRTQLPATFAALGERAGELGRRFGARHAPLDAHSVFNAMQFYRFLARERPGPPYLGDVCYCEVAMAVLGSRATRPACTPPLPARGAILMRRRPGVRLRRSEYDIRPLLAERRREVERGAVFLVISRPPGSPFAKAFAVAEPVYDLLAALGRWHRLEPDDEWLAEEGTPASLRAFCELGILEMCEAGARCASA